MADTNTNIKSFFNALVDLLTPAQRDQVVALATILIAPPVVTPPVVTPPPVTPPIITPAGTIFGAISTTPPVGKVFRSPSPGAVINSGVTGDGKFWYGDGMRLNVNVDTVLHFIDDWHRTQLIEAIDPVTRKVLETATITNFGGTGVYLPVKVTRPLEIRMTVPNPPGTSALLSEIWT